MQCLSLAILKVLTIHRLALTTTVRWHVKGVIRCHIQRNCHVLGNLTISQVKSNSTWPLQLCEKCALWAAATDLLLTPEWLTVIHLGSVSLKSQNTHCASLIHFHTEVNCLLHHLHQMSILGKIIQRKRVWLIWSLINLYLQDAYVPIALMKCVCWVFEPCQLFHFHWGF